MIIMQFTLLNYREILIFVFIFLIQGKNLCQAAKWETIGPRGVSYNTTIKFNSNSNNFYAYGNNTLFKSDNGGESWYDISPDYLGDSYEFNLIISDKNPDEIYYLNIGRGTIFKSTDGGNKWELYYSGLNRRVIFLDKSNPNILISLKPTGGWGHFFQTIEKSYDAGKSWQTITNGMDTAVGPIGAWINPYSSGNIFAEQAISFGGDILYGHLFYKSTNSGLNWHKVNLDSSLDFQRVVFDPLDEDIFYIKQYNKPWTKTTNGGVSWFDLEINISGKNPDYLLVSSYIPGILYMGASGELPNEESDIYLSENGGTEWTKYSSLSPSQHISSILTDPFNTSEIYVSSYPFGIFKSTANGQNWVNKSAGLNQSEVCSFSAASSEIIYTGIANRGLYRTGNGGDSWEIIHKNLSSCPGKIVVSKNNPNLIFSNDYIEGMPFSVSQDGGDKWMNYPCSYNGLYIFDVANDDQTIYGDAFLGDIGGLIISGIIKSTDCGNSWQLMDLDIDNINYIDKIEIDPFNSEIVYAVAAIRGTINKNSLIRTTNGGTNWTIIADTAGNFFINKEDSRYVYHCYGKTIFISSDKGETFNKINSDYDLKDIVASKNKKGELYSIAYNGSVIKSEDYGYSWKEIDDLSKDVGIQDLQICYSNSGSPILLGSTWHHGLLKCELNNPLIYSKKEEVNNLQYQLSQNFPNPFNPRTTIIYSLPLESEVQLFIYNMLGEKVAELVNKFQKAGRYEIEWNAENYSSGIYICQIKAGKFISSKKLILLK